MYYDSLCVIWSLRYDAYTMFTLNRILFLFHCKSALEKNRNWYSCVKIKKYEKLNKKKGSITFLQKQYAKLMTFNDPHPIFILFFIQLLHHCKTFLVKSTRDCSDLGTITLLVCRLWRIRVNFCGSCKRCFCDAAA